jgi:multicomponent Na+:H+ antiporter subunit B
MHDSLMLRMAMSVLLPLALVLSIFLLLQGYQAPGGGMVGGLLASAAIVLHIIVVGPAQTRRILPLNYRGIAALGLLLVFAEGSLGALAGLPFLSGLWMTGIVPGIGELGTPILLNVVLYVVLVGLTTQTALLLAEEAAPMGDE